MHLMNQTNQRLEEWRFLVNLSMVLLKKKKMMMMLMMILMNLFQELSAVGVEVVETMELKMMIASEEMQMKKQDLGMFVLLVWVLIALDFLVNELW